MTNFKQKCVNCHFLIKVMRTPDKDNKLTIDEKQRDMIRKGNFDLDIKEAFLECYFNVWQNLGTDRDNLLAEIVEMKRKDYCFFWNYRPKMSLPAAKILQKREAQMSEANKDRKQVKCGLWIAAIALLINTILAIVNLLK